MTYRSLPSPVYVSNQFSKNGAPLLTGFGVAAVRKRIEDSFASITRPEPAPTLLSPRDCDCFYLDAADPGKLAAKLAAAALTSSLCFSNAPQGPFEISVPSESAELLFSLALGRQS